MSVTWKKQADETATPFVDFMQGVFRVVALAALGFTIAVAVSSMGLQSVLIAIKVVAFGLIALFSLGFIVAVYGSHPDREVHALVSASLLLVLVTLSYVVNHFIVPTG